MVQPGSPLRASGTPCTIATMAGATGCATFASRHSLPGWHVSCGGGYVIIIHPLVARNGTGVQSKDRFQSRNRPTLLCQATHSFVLWQRTNARGSCMTAPGMPPAGTGPRRQAEEARQATPPGRPTLCIDLKPGERSAGVRTPDPRTPWRALRSSARWHATRGTTEPKAPRSGPSIREAPSPAPPLYRAAGGTPQ